jgi:thymidylate synthase (FAD)
MEVKLIDYQKNALDILIHTKSTRLAAGQTLEEIERWPMEKKLDHLRYMRNTIASSWEFVRYIFEIKGVSRVLTHQLVRTRTQSYAQESQRTIDAVGNGFFTPESLIDDIGYKAQCHDAFLEYNGLQNNGASNQDARYVLPESTLTNIIVGTDLRTLSHTAEVRLCTRTQGEYQDVFRAIRQKVFEVHPWAEIFIEVGCVKRGVCIFPNYKECPIQPYTVIITDVKRAEIRDAWKNTRHEARPIATDGKTMHGEL